MQKPINQMTDAEFSAFVDTLRDRRKLRPKAKPKRNTPAELSRALQIDESKIIEALLNEDKK